MQKKQKFPDKRRHILARGAPKQQLLFIILLFQQKNNFDLSSDVDFFATLSIEQEGFVKLTPLKLNYSNI